VASARCRIDVRRRICCSAMRVIVSAESEPLLRLIGAAQWRVALDAGAVVDAARLCDEVRWDAGGAGSMGFPQLIGPLPR
jgi:hypothetical protein